MQKIYEIHTHEKTSPQGQSSKKHSVHGSSNSFDEEALLYGL